MSVWHPQMELTRTRSITTAIFIIINIINFRHQSLTMQSTIQITIPIPSIALWVQLLLPLPLVFMNCLNVPFVQTLCTRQSIRYRFVHFDVFWGFDELGFVGIVDLICIFVGFWIKGEIFMKWLLWRFCF